MSAVDPCNLHLALGSAALVFLPALLGGGGGADMDYYASGRKHMPFSVPGWLFMPVWLVLYCVIVVAEILHALSLGGCGVDYDPRDQAILSLFLINVTLNHFWTVAFFKMRNPLVALLDAILLFGTAAALAGLYGSEELWVSMGMFIAYALWLGFAILLNALWMACVPRSVWQKKGAVD